MIESPEQIEANAKVRQDRDFASWLDEPMTRMCISAIPPAERPEALQLLLRAAFDRGFNVGSSHMVGTLVKAMLEKKPPP